MNEKLVGVIAFNDIDFKNKIGYIGYWLAEKYQGKGIMTQSVAAIVNYGFNELSLNKMELRIGIDNKPSCAIAERLGFQIEGRIRQAEKLNNYFIDHYIYGLLQNEWNPTNTNN